MLDNENTNISPNNSWKDISEWFDEECKSNWEESGFNYQSTKQWIDVGLEPWEYEFATYAKQKGYNPNSVSSEELRKECNTYWLDKEYPQEKRVSVTELNISERSLKGILELEDFVNLETLNCSYNDLTNLGVRDCFNLKRINCSFNQLTSLSINGLTKLQEFGCWMNKLTNLDLSSFSQLKRVECNDNKLINLNLTNCSNITFLNCYNNSLADLDFLKDLSSDNLKRILISNNNFPPSNLNPFARFVNLNGLGLFSTRFFGSLEPLKNLTKLEYLNIHSTDISEGLEYLSESILKFRCSTSEKSESEVKKIMDQLRDYTIDAETGKYDLKKWRDENIVKMVPTLPPSLSNEKENDFAENHKIEKINYGKIYPESSLSQKIDDSIVLSANKLPIKLYNINKPELTKDNVEITENNPNIKNYAILSYVWGGNYDNKTGKLSLGGQKSLVKAVKACQHLGVNYLWIDQWCIDQNNNEEKAQEVKKMGQYYSNASVTLVAIQTKAKVNEEELDLLDILKRITCSEWFTRSWTFQEGWLSKWTLFMFDDILVDGREMAALWVFQQPSQAGIRFSKSEKGSKKVATPIGWVYYKGNDEKGYKSTDTVSLRLHEALREIKSRGRGNPVDGIYSILGLLPYGNKVEVKYKKNICEDCKNKEKEQNESIDCKCPEEKRTEFPTYFESELKERLINIMKIAIQNGHGEPLSWHGIGNGWLPQINSKGSTTIEGGIKVDYVPSQNQKEEVIQKNGIKITGSEYVIAKSSDTMSRWDQSSSIESGARERKVWIKGEDEGIELSGTKEILSLMSKLLKEQRNILLLIPNRDQWRSAKPFAILVEIKENNHYGLGLVEISEGSEKLAWVKEKEILIRVNDSDPYQIKEKQVVSENINDNELEKLKEKLVKIEAERDEWKKKFQELEQQTQSQIQIPPK